MRYVDGLHAACLLFLYFLVGAWRCLSKDMSLEGTPLLFLRLKWRRLERTRRGESGREDIVEGSDAVSQTGAATHSAGSDGRMAWIAANKTTIGAV